ncbi:MAG: transglutaminase domain-containing protein [Candidatus Thermoplasmatota archaeon]|nr:transglutaminase domain-containing protein [Candidatus Thermoplasmatota archaeon]
MSQHPQIRGWEIHHYEQLFMKASAGAPAIRLKFYHYPSYRQTVHIIQPPAGCKIKRKHNNMFFLFQQKVHTKGMISLERVVSVLPQVSFISPNESWGRISAIPWLLQRKYKQNYAYWPLHSTAMNTVADERWFSTDELSTWTQEVSRYIMATIQHPEKQEKRLGADEAILSKSGDCDEFTDLFVTLARMRGVPCRRLTGYYATQGKDPEPHAWGELLSPTKGWIPIDIALHNLGHHTINYVIGKIEEFTPQLVDYQVQKQSSLVHYRWERPLPLFTPLY